MRSRSVLCLGTLLLVAGATGRSLNGPGSIVVVAEKRKPSSARGMVQAVPRSGGGEHHHLPHGISWKLPRLERGSTLSTMTWMGACVAYGSMGLVAGALTPKSVGPAGRTLCAALTMLAFGWPVETIVNMLGRAASLRAVSHNNQRASTLAERLGALSDALQALVMTTTSLAMCALSWRHYGSQVTPLALATTPGALITSISFAMRGRPPRAIHGWVPFVILLSSTHALFFDALGAAGKRRFGELISTWSAISAIIAVSSLRCLAIQANAASTWGPPSDLSRAATFVAGLPGLGAIAGISVSCCLAWVASALAWWGFHSIHLRAGLGVVAFVSCAMEIAGARAAEVGAVVDHAGCRRIGRLSVLAFQRCSTVAIVQATSRAFWLDGSARRLERNFISILLVYFSYGVAGAVRGLFWRSVASTLGLIAVLLRTLYVSLHNQEPVAFAGAVGLTVGVALIVAVLVIPNVFESSWGSEAKGLFSELAGLFDDLTSPSRRSDAPTRDDEKSDETLYAPPPPP